MAGSSLVLYSVTVGLTVTEEAGKGGSFGVVLMAIITVFYVLTYIGMLIFTVRVTKSDPTDPTVAFERQI